MFGYLNVDWETENDVELGEHLTGENQNVTSSNDKTVFLIVICQEKLVDNTRKMSIAVG